MENVEKGKCQQVIPDPGNKTSQNDKKPRATTTEKLIALFTFIIIIVGGFQAYYINKSDKTARLRDRAYLYFLGVDNGAYPNDENILGYRNDIFLENAGSMPARRVSVKHGWKEIKRTENISDPWSLIKWDTAQIASVVGPKQRIGFQGRGIPVNIMDSVKKLEFDIYIAMEATYLDGFSETTRITQMCRILRYDKAGGHSLSFTNSHNCTDDDCPKEN